MLAFNKSLIIHSKHYKYVLSILQSYGGESRLIGGCVRDALLGKINYDIDIATTLLPKQVIAALSIDKNIKIVPTGINYGTISVFIDKEKFEITTLRQDINCDGRYANVKYTDDFLQDSTRRDFTINAISYCPFKSIIYDYHNGIEDVKSKKVIFIGDAKFRIKEDYLRILRFFRFSADYAKRTDAIALQACLELKEGINYLSKERIKSEMDKIVNSNNSPAILRQMNKIGIFTLIFPKICDFETLERVINFGQEVGVNLTNNVKYSALFNYQYKDLPYFKKMLNDFKFSIQESNKICSLLEWVSKPINQSMAYMLKECWIDFEDYLLYISLGVGTLLINHDIAREFIAEHKKFNPPIFPIDGHDLLRMGFNGRKLGVLLQKLKILWIDSGFSMNKTELLTQINYYNKIH